MKAVKIHEFSNGGMLAKLGNQNVYMISVSDTQYAYWTLPPWDNPEPIRKDEVEWTEAEK